MRTDPIELEIFKHLFAAVAEEMGMRLMRSAYSPNIKERRDFSCAIFNAAGELLAQAAHIPVHLGAMPQSVRAVLEVFPLASQQAGDVFVVNDPFAGGTHLPDITVVSPVCLPGEGAPRFLVANRAHHADVGGITPGSMPLSTSIEDEGLRIPPRRLDAECLNWITSNTRTPEERQGDLKAQQAALRLGCERISEMCLRYGAEHVEAQGRALISYTEQIMRAIVAGIPAGKYHARDYLDGDGFEAQDIKLELELVVAGGQAQLDFSGSADQVQGPVNAVRAITLSAVNYAFRCLAPADMPSNGGVMRPFSVVTRPGSVLDAQYPAAVAAGNVETSQRVVDLVFTALSKALPERIPAASSGSMSNVTIGGVDPRTGSRFAYYETIAGGAGAGPSRAGAAGVHTHMTNTLNTPVEALEHAYPLLLKEYSINEGSGGQGLRLGGDGLTRSYQFLSAAEVTLLGERRLREPPGREGGSAGRSGLDKLQTATGTRELAAKQSINVDAGDILEINTPGGGGVGLTRRK